MDISNGKIGHYIEKNDWFPISNDSIQHSNMEIEIELMQLFQIKDYIDV